MLCISQYCQSVFAKEYCNYAGIEIAETHERKLGQDYGKVYTDAVKWFIPNLRFGRLVYGHYFYLNVRFQYKADLHWYWTTDHYTNK